MMLKQIRKLLGLKRYFHIYYKTEHGESYGNIDSTGYNFPNKKDLQDYVKKEYDKELIFIVNIIEMSKNDYKDFIKT